MATLKELFTLKSHQIESFKRPKPKKDKQPGGGCAIFYSEERFHRIEHYVHVPKGVETCWIILKPKSLKKTEVIKQIAICSVYVCPTSKYKTATVDHIIGSIHLIITRIDLTIIYFILHF